MASLNIPQVDVFLNPTIAVASTGSEILDLGVTQTNDSQIRSSNHLTLEALLEVMVLKYYKWDQLLMI